MIAEFSCFLGGRLDRDEITSDHDIPDVLEDRVAGLGRFRDSAFDTTSEVILDRLRQILFEIVFFDDGLAISKSRRIGNTWARGDYFHRVTDHVGQHEIDEWRANLAKENFKRAGVSKLVNLVEGDAHERVKEIKDPIDMIFLDADKEGYVDYLEKLLPKVRPGGLILAHNINERQADPKYIEAITKNPKLETLFFAEGGGFSVTMKKR